MRKVSEIRADLSSKVEKVRAMQTTEESFEAEVKALDNLRSELEAAEKVELAAKAAAEKAFGDLEKSAGRQFSISKFIREAASREGLTGLEAEVARMGEDEYRRLGLSQKGLVIPAQALNSIARAASGQNYGTNADGGYLIEQMGAKYLEALKDRLVVNQLGATFLSGLVGTLPLITPSSFVAGWLAEGASGSITKAAFARVTMTPHRNFVAGAVTKDLLRQTSYAVDRFVANALMDAHARAIDTAAINGSGQNNQPKGILNDTGISVVAMGTNGAAITHAKVVELETAINAANANRGSMAYLANAKVIGALKTVEKASNTARFLLSDDGKMLNGYPVQWTNLVPSNLSKGTGSNLSALIFGNWEDLFIGEWGGIDLVVDPYTNAHLGEIRIILNAWNDAVVAEPKSFAAIKDIVA